MSLWCQVSICLQAAACSQTFSVHGKISCPLMPRLPYQDARQQDCFRGYFARAAGPAVSCTIQLFADHCNASKGLYLVPELERDISLETGLL